MSELRGPRPVDASRRRAPRRHQSECDQAVPHRVSPLSTEEVEIRDPDATHSDRSPQVEARHGTTTSFCAAPSAFARHASGDRRAARARRRRRSRPAAWATSRAWCAAKSFSGTSYIEWPMSVSARPTTGRLGIVRLGPAERPRQTIRARGAAASIAAASGSPQSGSKTYVGPSPPQASRKAAARPRRQPDGRVRASARPLARARSVRARRRQPAGAEQLRRLERDEPGRAGRAEHEHAVARLDRRPPRERQPPGEAAIPSAASPASRPSGRSDRPGRRRAARARPWRRTGRRSRSPRRGPRRTARRACADRLVAGDEREVLLRVRDAAGAASRSEGLMRRRDDLEQLALGLVAVDDLGTLPGSRTNAAHR